MKKIIAFLLAFLLTGALILFGVSFTARQVILPALGSGGAPVSNGLIREEQQLARERVTGIAGIYGFDPEPVAGLITEDVLRDLNSQASDWWSMLLQEGWVGDAPSWSTAELEQVIAADPALNSAEDSDEAESVAAAAAESIRNSVVRMVLPMRLQTFRLGMKEVSKRVDVVSLITFFMQISWTALALSALLAGLIALLRSRNFSGSVQFIGSALGGAALVLAALMILVLCSGILPMIREASSGLTIQYQGVVSGILLRGGILAACMAAGCILCLAGAGKNRKTA